MDRQMDKYDESHTQTSRVFFSQCSCQFWNSGKTLQVNFNIYSKARRKSLKIFHFRVTLSLFIKARLGAQSFCDKIGLFSCECKLTFGKKKREPRFALKLIQKWPGVLSTMGDRLEFQGALKLQKNWFWTRQKSGKVPVTLMNVKPRFPFILCGNVVNQTLTLHSALEKWCTSGSWDFHIYFLQIFWNLSLSQ